MGQVNPVYVQDTLTAEQCYKCAVWFAMPQSLQTRCRGTGETIYCPNGHGQVYMKSTEAKLREELEAERQRKIAALSEANEQRMERERLERKLKRVGRGVCPECNRSFANLAKHMNCKHAEKAK